MTARFPLILSLLASLAGCSAPPPAPQPRAALAPARLTAVPQVKGWPDRRPIARLDLCNEVERQFAPLANPRAWNGYWHRDPAGNPLDARDPEYIQKFAVAYKTNCFTPALDRTVAMGGQGVCILDVEGREQDQPTTYLGNAGTCRPPEMTDALVRWMAHECKARNLWIGFTVRHTAPLRTPYGVRQFFAGTYSDALMQNICTMRWVLAPQVNDPEDLSLVDRFAYYDSSNQPNAFGTGKGPLPTPAAELRKVTEGVPQMLIETEWGSLAYKVEWGDKAYLANTNVAPWREAALPESAISRAIKKQYGSFEIIMPTPGWTATQADEDRLVQEVKGGDVMLFAASWDHPINALVRRVYDRAAGKTPQAQPRLASKSRGVTVPSRHWPQPHRDLN